MISALRIVSSELKLLSYRGQMSLKIRTRTLHPKCKYGILALSHSPSFHKNMCTSISVKRSREQVTDPDERDGQGRQNN